jgi:lantibiotic leader peptide-processing serine protease
MKRASLPVLIAAAVFTAACVDDPVAPTRNTTLRPEMYEASVDGQYLMSITLPIANLEEKVAEQGGHVIYQNQQIGFAWVGGLTQEGAQALDLLNGVNGVYNDAAIHLNTVSMMGESEVLSADPTSIAQPATAFRHSFQWNMRRIGAPAVWAAGHLGSSDVTIAILDSGIDYTSFDASGMVDLARSISFVPSDDDFMNTHLPTRHKSDDLNGHGSNVATQAASNATIFAGVTSKSRLMSVKVLGRTGSGSIGGILSGLAYAVDNGADVINMSLGIPGGILREGNDEFLRITRKAFAYAYENGAVVVVSAGNDGQNMDLTPERYRVYCDALVICVSATGPTSSTNAFSGPWTDEDALASYSNYGQAVYISAPGGTNRGWVSSVCPRFRASVSATGVVSFPCNLAPGFFITTGYAGTSQAAPHVAGYAALLVAKFGKNNPKKIFTEMRRFGTLDDLGARGKDPIYGFGRLNLEKALITNAVN